MRRFLLFILGLIWFIGESTAQSCTTIFAGNDTTYPCTQTCFTLNAKVPDVRSTENYAVNQIPYNPYPYTTTAPVLNLSCTNQDDKFFSTSYLPFTFCFYNDTYSAFVIGTNGLITFDTSNSLRCNGWDLTTASGGGPIPWTGNGFCSSSGSCSTPTNAIYPRAAIMGVYQDLDIDFSSPNKKMEYRVEGSYPCRRAIISFNEIPYYSTLNSCQSFVGTSEIVLYEGTGIIEVYVKDKPMCSSWNGGLSILGIQNWNRDQAVAPIGKNATQWSAQNEAYRFTPNGTTSSFKRVELFKNGVLVSTGTTVSDGNGNLNVSFPNVCQPELNADYTVKAFYKLCSDITSETELDGVINVSKTAGPMAATTVNANCVTGNGTITVTDPVGLNFEYSIDRVTWQSSNVFTKPAGTYNVFARIVNTTCVSNVTVVIGSSSTLTATAVSTTASCSGVSNGTITVNASAGTAPYLYSINNGVTYQASNVFTGLAAGTYTITIKDAGGCTFSFQQIVGSNSGVTGNATVTNAGCPGSRTGSITVNINAGTGAAPFTYSLNGGAFQSSNIFNNLSASTYTIVIKDAGGCTYTFNATVNNNPLLNTTLAVIEPSCFNTSTGSITINASLGTAPYQYAVNASAYQVSNVFYNIAAGNYIVHTKDATGCIKDTAITINQPVLLTAIADTVASTCNGNDGAITVLATGGTSPYQYSKDNEVTYQNTNVFNVAPGSYNIVVKDNKGCTVSKTATVTLIDAMYLDLGADKTICFGSPLTLTPNTNAGTSIFNWSPAAGLSSTTIQSPAANPNDTTKYYLTAKWGVCQRTDSVIINVLRKPVANAGSDTIICDRSFALLHGSASNLSGPINYLWSPANEISNPTSNTTIATPTTIGAHTYTLEVDDSYGCNFKVYDDVIVTMNPRVPAFAGNDTIAAMDLPFQLTGSGGVQYLWSPAAVLDDATKANPIAILHNDTRFTLIVKDNGGCIGYDTVFIKVYKGPTYYLPNAFTPNGDGLNDEFRAIAPGIVSTEYFRIFNRWGQMVFETNQYMKGWDGTYLGKKQPDGVYVWIIKGVDKFGKTIEMKGTVVLIR